MTKVTEEWENALLKLQMFLTKNAPQLEQKQKQASASTKMTEEKRKKLDEDLRRILNEDEPFI